MSMIKSKVTTDIAPKNVHDQYQEKSDKTLKNVHDQEESDKTLKNVHTDPYGGKGQVHDSALFMLRFCSSVSKNLYNFHFDAADYLTIFFAMISVWCSEF